MKREKFVIQVLPPTITNNGPNSLCSYYMYIAYVKCNYRYIAQVIQPGF